jgi:hypothetical protein
MQAKNERLDLLFKTHLGQGIEGGRGNRGRDVPKGTYGMG